MIRFWAIHHLLWTLTAVCLSNRIKMSKTDKLIYISSCHICVQITIYISKAKYLCPKLRYMCPSCNIYISTFSRAFLDIYIFYYHYAIYVSIEMSPILRLTCFYVLWNVGLKMARLIWGPYGANYFKAKFIPAVTLKVQTSGSTHHACILFPSFRS